MLDDFVEWAPAPKDFVMQENLICAISGAAIFTGFVFKIQANMDPKHRDRIAFMRICSGELYERGMKMRHTRALGKDVKSRGCGDLSGR